MTHPVAIDALLEAARQGLDRVQPADLAGGFQAWKRLGRDAPYSSSASATDRAPRAREGTD